MIRLTLSLILLILSVINYSSLYSNSTLSGYSINRIVVYSSALLLLIALEGSLGLLIITSGIDKIYHTLLMFILILLLLIVINLDAFVFLWKEGSLRFRREGFDALMYVIIIYLFLYHTSAIIPNYINVPLTSGLAVLLACVVFYLWRYNKELEMLVEYIDIITPAKVFMFSCMLTSAYGILIDLYAGLKCIGLSVSILSFFVTYLILFKELARKYIGLKEV